MSGLDPNSVRKALQGAMPSGDHPDADLLTAFSEGTLLPRERETVLAHAADCVECRRVLNLAAGAALASPQAEAVRAANPKWNVRRIWIPTFAAAAALLLVAIVLIRNTPEKRDAPQNVAANVSATVSPAEPQISAKAQTEATHAKDTTIFQAKKKDGQQPQSAPPERDNNGALATAEMAPAEASRMQSAASVSAFSNTVTSKALATALKSSIARPHWHINDLGQPERSYGNGQWEQVLPNKSPKMRVLSVYEGEVWVGGEQSAVMRSFDDGTTWRVVSLPEKNGKDHVIAHIRFDSAEAITIEAVDGTAWSSVDGGETWK